VHFTFTPQDAQVLALLLASVVVPFVTSLIKRASFTPAVKLLIAVLVSAAGGFLAEYASGSLVDVSSVIVAGGIVFTASQAHFATWFGALGLDEVLTKIGE
jgi:uncharacterized membrane protein YccC